MPADARTAASQSEALSRIKWFSTFLLLFVTLLYGLSRRFESQHPELSIVAAFAEAAMVGALADWFAVVALFRYPMGIPLPHTAIIPRNKGRIADNLGAFITGNFLRTEVILEKIRAFDPAARFAEWLSLRESGDRLGGYAIKALGYGLDAIQDQRVNRFIHEAVVAQLERMDFARLAGQVLEVMTQDGRHQQLLNASIHQIRILIEDEATRQRIAELIAREFEQWPKYLLNTVKMDKLIGAYSAKKLVAGVVRLLAEIEQDDQHPLRRRFDRSVMEFIVKLKTDPDFRVKAEEIRDQILGRPELAAYSRGLWIQFKTWLRRDLQSPDSSIKARIAGATLGLGNKLRADREMQAWINDQLLAAAKPFCEHYRKNIGKFISDQVKSWDERYMVQQLELNIGKDLQYIRINGTLIGGLMGLLIYGCTGLIRG